MTRGGPRRSPSGRARLQQTRGPVAVSIEHIGSTAVPGLAAQPVIDIQVSVRDLDDEASYVPAIETLGVAFRSREPGHSYFPPGRDGATHGADPRLPGGEHGGP